MNLVNIAYHPFDCHYLKAYLMVKMDMLR